MISTTSPNRTPGTRLVNEMKKMFTNAVNALRAWACLTASASGPNTRSGAIETETNSKPISAALAATLAVKNGWYSAGTTRRKFEACGLVVSVGG